MLRSLFTGISGLKAHQQMMDVVSNNIANVNTTGFKTSNIVFEDTLSQLLRAAGASTATSGGLDPTQIGLGVKLAAVQQNFAQGSAQVTNKATDLMINGDGFFVLDDGGTQVYSRAGAFTLDNDGFLVNPNGMYVQGFQAVDGALTAYGELGRLQLQAGLSIPGSATTTVSLGGNLDPEGTAELQVTATVYDEGGAAYAVPIILTPNGDGTYAVQARDPADNDADLGTAGTVAFDTAGRYDAGASTAPTFTINGVNMTVDLSQFTGYAGISGPQTRDVDGFAAGTLNEFQIGPDGVITGIFSNGQKQALGQLALATFNNVNGLEKQGDSVYRDTANSGLPQIGIAGSGGVGLVTGGALEMSNVDLAAEFTNMIIAQRAFQANSKVITSSDEILQELVNIKR
ncbi:flagellar hook protein FlgE [Kineosporia sp. NBRC 101677]|uniref:flagellar basal-body rod protein FlgF n=1 Tax=Kineosporia sp. NBRC 101677 TaxID=3032197 RepID=UPI0024A047E6|nr:flagellar basal-body rod protein FlgF [Kineosporia sp. NBRC 101677]GLY13956.1 flagellar hook protein FlgE [Kineosporia sp. NBRC 101677]